MIEPTYFALIIVLLAIGTIMIRGSLIALSSRVVISSRTKELLSFIPAALLPALFVPAAFHHHGIVDWAFGKERLLILLLAGLVAYYSRNTLITVAFGLSTLYVLTQVL